MSQSTTVPPFSRRGFLAGCAGLTASCFASTLASPSARAATQDTSPSLRYCLNTSTINGSKLPLRTQIQVAADAGYDAVELWVRDIERFVEAGGTLRDLATELQDLGLGVDSAIAFGQWIVDDDQQRQAGLDQCQRDMETVRAIGARRIAAPPAGATKEPGLDLDKAAERYRELLDLGQSVDVQPQLELWGFSKNVSTLAEVLYIAAAAQHENACILLDVYHMYKGGNDFNNLGLIPATNMYCLHMNDYPAMPPRAEIGDKDRVYPGDGVAPLDSILQSLVRGGFAGTLSLELFNRSYWEQPPEDVAATGLKKMRASVERALA